MHNVFLYKSTISLYTDLKQRCSTDEFFFFLRSVRFQSATSLLSVHKGVLSLLRLDKQCPRCPFVPLRLFSGFMLFIGVSSKPAGLIDSFAAKGNCCGIVGQVRVAPRSRHSTACHPLMLLHDLPLRASHKTTVGACVSTTQSYCLGSITYPCLLCFCPTFQVAWLLSIQPLHVDALIGLNTKTQNRL